MFSSSQLLTLLQVSLGHTTLPQNVSLQTFTGVSTDSRTVESGELFIALRGEKFDGHRFLRMAQERGAAGAIVDDQYDPATIVDLDLPLWQVSNTLKAYQAIGQWWRQQFQIPIVGVTGSVGKTTTKELIAAMLGQQGPVLKTQANFNNEIGVPKTLLQLQPDHHQYGVIEMAMRGAGEIAELTRIAQPTIGLITNVGVAHIERLGSREAIAAAKCELLVEMPATSTAILNADNPLLMETAANCWTGRTLTFGLSAGDIRGKLVDLNTLEVDGKCFHLPLPGEHNAVNFLAGLAVAQVLEIPWASLTHLKLNLPEGRSQRHTLPNDIVLLDETYNAGPESMTAALKLLMQTPGQRHIAVLGTMKELGYRSLAFHQEIGQVVQQLNLDALYVLADQPEAEALATEATPVPASIFESHEALAQQLLTDLHSGDRVLFKASRSVALDRVVEQVLMGMAPEQ
ncbi:MAG: UDP-N-acetylmuramoyl-tripeptide--D-alanyl-D-alanine ligase [Prochlorotrichaceae cyanobacterium]